MDRDAFKERFGIVGTSDALDHVIDRVRQVARTDITVLIQGESGVGKELIAEAVHALSPRRHGPLVVVNCGAIPEGLIESELFGAEKGAYTGAAERRKGYFEEADGSTIFLDEIGEMPQAAQVRLLRVLESGQFSRVGSAQTQQTDVRVVAATNRDLGREVAEGRFREDLYYRLSTVLIHMPPLRERPEDILPLFQHFVHRAVQEYDARPKQLTEEAEALLRRYGWPGNVRELRNVAEQAVVLTVKRELEADDLRPFLRGVALQRRRADAEPERSQSLVPVARPPEAESGDPRERELIYRALVELRLELRELKEQVATLTSAAHVVVPQHDRPTEARGPDGPGGFVIVRSDPSDEAPFFEEVPYVLEGERTAPPPPAPEPEREEILPGLHLDEGAPLPSVEDLEARLIAEGLRRFDGNRRETARALGISERTLYRKLKDVEAAEEQA